MKQHTYISISKIFFLCLITQLCQAQKTDSIPIFKDSYGVRIGTDVFKIARSFYDKNYQGLEFVGDFRISKKTYLAAEIGNEKITINDDRLSFTNSGSYIKVGLDKNLYENWLDMENIVFIGFRYSFSAFSQKLNNYQIYNTDNYFGESPAFEAGTEFNGLTAQWLEVVLGIKAEMLPNLYLGFNFRLNRLLTDTKPTNFNNLHINGFGRISEGNNFGASFNYTISYFIPIYKKSKLNDRAPLK
jgi:hypothetical protein